MMDVVNKGLTKGGFVAEALYGGLYQRQRNSVMNKCRKNLANVLVATDVAASDIDIDNIEAVINFDIPNDTDSYVHRIGRIGRESHDGCSYTFTYAKEQFKPDSIMTYKKILLLV